ncbi:MAG: hypothetical protein MW690_001430 [Methanophagales archaeon]|nr:hypothetical protein [Methanophagales archaeon]
MQFQVVFSERSAVVSSGYFLHAFDFDCCFYAFSHRFLHSILAQPVNYDFKHRIHAIWNLRVLNNASAASDRICGSLLRA